MDSKDIQEKIKKIIADQTGKNESDIGDDVDIANDLGADSLGIAEIIINLEHDFGITISDEAAEKLRTPSDAVKFIDNALKDKKTSSAPAG